MARKKRSSDSSNDKAEPLDRSAANPDPLLDKLLKGIDNSEVEPSFDWSIFDVADPHRAPERQRTVAFRRQIERTLKNAPRSPDDILNEWLAAKDVAADARPAFVAKINQMVDRVARPQWNDRANFEQLSHLTAPRFLRAVYPDALDAAGRLANEALIRLSDPTLVRMIQAYVSNRTDRKQPLGDAEGLIFTQKDGRGRPKKPRNMKARQPRRSP